MRRRNILRRATHTRDPMANMLANFGCRSMVLVMMTGVMVVHASIAIGGMSAAHWFCVTTLQHTDHLLVESRSNGEVDSCCRWNPSCEAVGRNADGETSESSSENPTDKSSSDECPCCVLIMSAPLCGSNGSLPLLPLSIVTIDSAIPADHCHAFGWVSSLLRPPSA